jgi:Arm DNA-binding domain
VPETGAVEYADQVVPGLRVKIGTAGFKSFVLRTRVGAKVKVVTLGRYGPRFKLADARKTARRVLVDFGAGKDPSADFKQEATIDRKTVAGLYTDWLKSMSMDCDRPKMCGAFLRSIYCQFWLSARPPRLTARILFG